ncbi:hypothetical protein SMACR_03764 [Sordaria macrospora]|uniref:WGS project CABT00000000 data, contig 2.16 n=2 Tax=Sordaria macrospora TaxID=5147 RepID=F7VZV8_SORMK|nr:uncharacterized protein SMAC_03764 [Sordaria macrospora k-hell]KAA8629450.1 hypothetical protein SMACR_03764 [Sordaria macrospora]KAH7631321.1 hypothetical protein B0T09DRAFT_133189 [Sordaria sp. MPI-SDFR-AT-0083]WPJ61597.1 hypothetical protein SMAC4_03764 [Sordaria macrospora]CCC11057.1 unnamed protein product [Sordaria macrospora k-hell]
MKFTTTLAGLAALFASAAPASAQHATSATVTGFSATRNATHINYRATINVLPENALASFTHATVGLTLPTSSGAWTSTDPKLVLRFNVFTGTDQVRVLLSDTHVVANTVNLDYFSTYSTDWVPTGAAGSAAYTGPSAFTLA